MLHIDGLIKEQTFKDYNAAYSYVESLLPN